VNGLAEAAIGESGGDARRAVIGARFTPDYDLTFARRVTFSRFRFLNQYRSTS
jgi:hypothetical protein